MKKITNSHFKNFREAVNICCNKETDDIVFLSDMTSASKTGEKDHHPFYSDEFVSPFINMETIKLDDISGYRKDMQSLPAGKQFQKQSAVDAVCIDADNEWFLVEFKNAELKNELKSIKRKMLRSLWFGFYMLSKSQKDDGVLSDDALKFAREHVTYVVVLNHDKNIEEAEYIKEAEACNRHYCHRLFEDLINYYFKDVYFLTELEFREFVLKFKA